MKPPFDIEFLTEGCTHASLSNARKIKEAGYSLANAVLEYDANECDWNLEAYFFLEDFGSSSEFTHTFTGFSIGYGGEGPHGTLEFMKLFGITDVPKEHILTRVAMTGDKGQLILK